MTPYDPLRSPYTSQTPQNVERKVSEANLSRVLLKIVAGPNIRNSIAKVLSNNKVVLHAFGKKWA